MANRWDKTQRCPCCHTKMPYQHGRPYCPACERWAIYRTPYRIKQSADNDKEKIRRLNAYDIRILRRLVSLRISPVETANYLLSEKGIVPNATDET